MENYSFTAVETTTLIDLLKSRPDLVSGRLGGAFKSNREVIGEWDRVAIELRSIVPGRERSGAEVKKKWQDLKYRVKKKVAELSSQENGCGHVKSLTGIQEKVISLLDGTAIEPLTDETFDAIACQVDSEQATEKIIFTTNQPEISTLDIKIEEIVTAQDVIMEEIKSCSQENSLKTKLSTPRVQNFRKKLQTIRSIKDYDQVKELIELKKKSLELRRESNELKKKLLLEANQQNAHLKTLIRLKTLKYDMELQ